MRMERIAKATVTYKGRVISKNFIRRQMRHIIIKYAGRVWEFEGMVCLNDGGQQYQFHIPCRELGVNGIDYYIGGQLVSSKRM